MVGIQSRLTAEVSILAYAPAGHSESSFLSNSDLCNHLITLAHSPDSTFLSAISLTLGQPNLLYPTKSSSIFYPKLSQPCASQFR